MPRDKSSAKNVRDIKATEDASEPINEGTQIVPGNIPVLQIKLLDAINKNLIVLVRQNAKLIEMFQHIEGSSDV